MFFLFLFFSCFFTLYPGQSYCENLVNELPSHKKGQRADDKRAMDILVEELAKDTALGLLVGHALATSSILVILLLLEGFECRHPAGALWCVSTLMAGQKKNRRRGGENKKQKKQSSGELREVMQDGNLLVGEGRCRWWWWEKSGLVRS